MAALRSSVIALGAGEAEVASTLAKLAAVSQGGPPAALRLFKNGRDAKMARGARGLRHKVEAQRPTRRTRGMR